jgi:CxxC-x17-CxxC domain-containing protein
MTFQDKTIQCADCGANFTFTGREQEFFQSKGYVNEPKRCPTCRQSRRSQRSGAPAGAPRQMYPAVCAQCGKETEVPFEPRNGRPVYCSECYSKAKVNR